ncbi:hypothetical protein JRO89_XS13G0212700 [Xanthoceras sorbifolium]|uniref:Glycosyltransferase n=1 Tax=Xanthoceras sorbifolium TaxID=99658 RepID=A0ABQ8H9E7_9ROSI|nr:hypothetical protein JRO89_XS13G0212700 [Xanthoceras sorbifolium]
MDRTHVVAMPHPARGHINPMMNLCKSLASKRPHHILITFVVTEEWLGFISSDAYPTNITFATIPDNIIPSEKLHGADPNTFMMAVMTKMRAPFEQILDGLHQPVTAIITDSFLLWAVDVGNCRNIPVAGLWTPSATVFSISYHSDLLTEKGVPLDLEENADYVLDFIPGISSIRVADLPDVFVKNDQNIVNAEPFKLMVSKVQYFLFASIYELESQVFEVLKPKFNIPAYSVGPLIPYSSINSNDHQEPDYIKWLNSQPTSSVLYVSMGSLFSVSSAQMDEMVAGLKSSGVRYLWVGREHTSQLEDGCSDLGLVVPWCDQLRVLCHSSVGGFLTHCGWSSTMEGAFAGVPMLTLPLFGDQFPDSKQIVEDWKIGRRLKEAVRDEKLVTRGEIAELVRNFMDIHGSERIELVKRAKQVQIICQGAVAKGGSTDANIDAFMKDITQGHLH